MERNIRDVAVGSIWDPMVRNCMIAGAGAEISLRFGAKTAPATGTPIDARVRVDKIVRTLSKPSGTA